MVPASQWVPARSSFGRGRERGRYGGPSGRSVTGASLAGDRKPSERQDSSRLARGAGITIFGRLGGRGSQLIGQIVLARVLGPEAFGLYAIGFTLLRVFGFLSVLGLDTGVIFFASRYWKKDLSALKAALQEGVGAAGAFGALVGLGLFLLASWLAERVFHQPALAPVIRWFVPAFLFAAALRVAAAATRTVQRMQYSVWTQDICQPVASLVLILLSAWMGWGLLGAVGATVASFAVALVLGWSFVRRLFPEAFQRGVQSRSVFREMIVYSIPASLAGMAALYLVWIDRLMVGMFRPAADVGVYQAVTQLAIAFPTILTAFGSVITPMIAQLYHQGEIPRLEALFRTSTRWGLYLCLPAALVVCFAPGEVLTVLFGSAYAGGAVPLVILTVGQLINVTTGSTHAVLLMTGQQRVWFIVSASMLAAGIALNWLLIPRLGLVGAAVAMSVTLSIQVILGLLLIRGRLRIWPYDHHFLKGAVVTAAAAATLALLDIVLKTAPPLFVLGAMVTAVVVVFGGGLLALGLDEADRDLLQAVRARLGGWGWRVQ